MTTEESPILIDDQDDMVSENIVSENDAINMVSEKDKVIVDDFFGVI